MQTSVSAPLVRVPVTKAWREGSPFSPLNLWVHENDLSNTLISLRIFSHCMCVRECVHARVLYISMTFYGDPHSVGHFPAFDQQIHKGTKNAIFFTKRRLADLNHLQQVQTGVSQSPHFRV